LSFCYRPGSGSPLCQVPLPETQGVQDHEKVQGENETEIK
jgi:hypothetical protein